MYNAGMRKKTAILNCRIDPKVKERADAAAERDRISLSAAVEILLDRYATQSEAGTGITSQGSPAKGKQAKPR